MKVLITGSTGMIGIALTKYLISKNIEVYMVIRKNSKKRDIIPNSSLINIIECNLDELSDLTLNTNIDYVIHLAWNCTIGNMRDDLDIQYDNIKYTLDAVRLAKRLNAKKFIGAGSQAEYGLKNEPLRIDTNCNPITAYGIAKLCAGNMSKLLCEQLNLEFNWIRILSVYGEYDNPNTLISYVKESLKNNISPNVSKCEQIWDYISSSDAAKVIYKIMTQGKHGVFYPLGGGEGRPLYEYLEEIKNNINPNIKINYGARDYNKNQVMYLVSDMSYLKEFKDEE